MSKTDTMRARLTVLEPVSLEIRDDSHQHLGHGGYRADGSHYSMRIVSEQFAGKNAVSRHRLVYAALGDMMRADIHAMNIQALTPDEAAGNGA